ncbi:MAG TPA: class I SAM-dependent methyltransferase [Acidobacteriota bacterium]|nr:class I SAM-dependent methyltransferase [Acidobacteriota bacterium]
MGQTPTAFDELAARYDQDFSRSTLGMCMRRAVWRRLDVHFKPGMRVLELNCGTGEDALYLARRGLHVTATDASPAMLEKTRRKAEEAGVQDRVEVKRIDLAAMESENELEGRRFDGALSDMGGLNCLPEWGSPARALARLLRPGSPLLLCVMGPLAAWDWIGFSLQGRPSQAVRRLHPGGVMWRGLRIRYPSPGRLSRSFRPAFRTTRLSAVGALLPPPLMGEDWARRHPGLLKRLEHWERRLETLFPLPYLADHYLMELERTRP